MPPNMLPSFGPLDGSGLPIISSNLVASMKMLTLLSVMVAVFIMVGWANKADDILAFRDVGHLCDLSLSSPKIRFSSCF